MLALNSLLAGKIPSGAAINFGASQSYTVLEIVQKIRMVLERPDLRPIIANIARNEILEQHVNFERAKDELGWTPEIDIDQGLRQTVNWYKNYFHYETSELSREAF